MMGAMRGYHFFGATVTVACDAPAVAQWLDEFLHPAFEPWTGAADFAVSVVTGPAAYAALAATRPPGALAEDACFALDSQVVTHPTWQSGGRMVLADAKYGTLYALDATEASVIAAPESSLFRGGVMRVVRETLTTRALLSANRIQLHAAACQLDGRVVLIMGPKGAGKTTLLGYLAAATGARILTNDRAVAERVDGGFLVRGVPTIVSIRPEARALIPRLYRGMTLERPAHLTLAELDAATRSGDRTEVTVRLRLSPRQLARQLGVELGADGPLAAVLFPRSSDARDDLEIERLRDDVAMRELRAGCFGASAGKAGATVFERLLPARRPAQADADLVEAIAAQVPCFAVRLGAGRFAAPHAASALLRTVLAESDAA